MSVMTTGGSALTVTINSNQIEGILHAAVATNNCFSSDSFSLTFAVGSAPLGDLAYWSSITSAYVEITLNTGNGATAQNVMTGTVDTVFIDPIQATVSIEGRDLSASLIDAYRQQDFVNQTASDVVTSVAQYHDLTASVTSTYSNVGRYYGDGFTRLSLGQFSRIRSDWDLLVQLARENSFDLFVQNRTLFFQPPDNTLAEVVEVSCIDLKSMQVERNLALTPSTAAQVQSWNSQNMETFDSSGAQSVTNGASARSATASQAFLFSASNFTEQQVSDSAKRYATELQRLATVLHFEMPWNFSFGPRTTIRLNGTNSAFDALYKIDSIDRHYNSRSGSSQRVRAIAIELSRYA